MSFRFCLLILLALELISCSRLSRPSEKVVIDALMSYKTGSKNFKIVGYGSTLVSEGYKSPKGTTLYPIEVNYEWGVGLGGQALRWRDVFYFYKDEFGRWTFYQK